MIKQRPCSYQLMKAADLREEDWAAWKQIQLSRTDLDSPFFHPGLTQLVAGVRGDVEVVRLQDGEKAVGFFPFQRDPGNKAQAITGRLCEFQGVVVGPDVLWDPEDLLRAAGLKVWHFDHLPVTQPQLAPYIWGEQDSLFMDLSKGYESYCATLKKTGCSLSQVERKRRKLIREVGPLRFEFYSEDESAFQSLVRWKTEQHKRTGFLPLFKLDWFYNLTDQLRKIRPAENFGGPLSALYAGGKLLAVHLGLQSHSAFHIWFPAYNVEFEKYSPGLILLLEMARAASDCDLQRIDFGRAGERYKANFKTGSIRIAEGAIDLRPCSARLRRQWFATKRWIRSSPYRELLERPLILTRNLRQRIAFRQPHKKSAEAERHS